jgi:hypothetical protein
VCNEDPNALAGPLSRFERELLLQYATRIALAPSNAKEVADIAREIELHLMASCGTRGDQDAWLKALSRAYHNRPGGPHSPKALQAYQGNLELFLRDAETLCEFLKG